MGKELKPVDWLFICKCGSMNTQPKFENHLIVEETALCSCGNCITMNDAYPNISSMDLARVLITLYNDSVKMDLENRDEADLFLKEQGVNLDKTTLSNFIMLYEKAHKSFPYNSKQHYLPIQDKFEEQLLKQGLNYDLSDVLISSFMALQIKNNTYRKPFIITLSAFIESLFNDFFEAILEYKLGSNGAKLFVKEYETASITQCLKIVRSFMQNSIEIELNSHSPKFYEQWDELRKLRNNIVHNNSIYISRIDISRFSKLYPLSLSVFSKIKSKIYSKQI